MAGSLVVVFPGSAENIVSVIGIQRGYWQKMKISATFLDENTKFYVEMVAVKSDVTLVIII